MAGRDARKTPGNIAATTAPPTIPINNPRGDTGSVLVPGDE
jgi:hypothetical protein